MDFQKCVSERRSIRKFKSLPVSEQDIKIICDSARLAPTARNVQPCEFVTIFNLKRIKELANLVSPNGAFLENAPACLIIFCQDTKYYLEDGCAATAQALLSATSLGLGGCWIAGDKKDYCDKVKSLVKAPSAYKLISIIALGYPDETPNPPKKSLNDMLHSEEF